MPGREAGEPGNRDVVEEGDALRDRLRRLLPDYTIERRAAVGGMGIVFRGRNRALDMPVAVKVLRPELATAVAAERFMREARLLAAVQHPSIVTVHDFPKTEGLFCFVMEWLGETLADRLPQRPMSETAVIRMGRQLLDGLARVHDRGIMHRDIKPSNIFFLPDGRAKLGDFGIARRDRSLEPPITETGSSHGTPAYMPPEQALSGDVTAAADLYAIGMVCYEALTGRRWPRKDPAAGDWTGVRRRLRSVLQRALALDPAARWPDARSFVRALVRRPVPAWVPWTVATAATAASLMWVWCPPPTVTGEVAVLPLRVEGDGPELGAELAIYVEWNLARAFDGAGLRVTPAALAQPWAERHPDAQDHLPPDAWSALHTSRILRGRVTRVGDSLSIEAELLPFDGRAVPLARITGSAEAPALLGSRLAFEVVRHVRPGRAGAFIGLRTMSDAAVADMVQAEYAFQQDNWAAAETFYRRAIARDSSLALAQWGLYNVRRWRRATTDADVAALRALYDRHADAFVGLDSLLIEADIAPTVPERLEIYGQAIRAYPYDPYPRLLLGNELFHRGALAGLGLDTAIAALQQAAMANPYVASTYSMLAWAFTRVGDARGADSALAAHARIGQAQPEQNFSMQDVLTLAAAARFQAPATAAREIGQVLSSPNGPASLAQTVRVGLAFGVPHAQLEIGGQLATLDDRRAQTIGLTAQALALLALGQVTEALARLDDAARVGHDPELAFEAAQWRVILPTLGVPGVSEAEQAAGRARLAEATGTDRAARAHWALLLDALARGAPAVDYLAGLDTARETPGLGALAVALAQAARGDTTRAVGIADSLRRHVLANAVEDPLERAVLFLRLGEWLASRDPRTADAAWRWYENADFAGWPAGHPQAAELDWALETFARYRRARLARSTGDAARACRLMPDAAARWANADAAYQPLRADLVAWIAACAPGS